MTDRNDRKLRQVPVGSYTYRHEAEFAAGFLKSAGIPYRLQIDDPALGLSASEGATLWVLAVDEGRARRVLDEERALPDEETLAEQDGTGAEESAGAEEWSGPKGKDPSPGETPGIGAVRPGPAGAVERGSGPGVDMTAKVSPDLTLRERILAIVAGLGVSGLMGVDAVTGVHPAVPWIVAACAVVLVLFGVLGRAPGPMRALLSAVSGDAP